MPVYAKSLGFSSVVVGTIYFILPAAGMLAKPLCGAIADRFRLHKFLFIFFQIITVIAFFSIQFIPEVPVKNKEVTLVCESEMNFHVNISNVYDKCTVERVTTLTDSNDLPKCKMKCDLSSEFENEICYHWRAPLHFCPNGNASSNVKNYVTDNAKFLSKKLKGTDVGKDAYSEKYKAFIIENNILEFDATVAMKHTLQVLLYDRPCESCMELKSRKMLFPKQTVLTGNFDNLIIVWVFIGLFVTAC